MGWFWVDRPTEQQPSSKSATPSPPRDSRCPVDHSRRPQSGCPRDSTSRSTFNPRNNMPDLPNAPMYQTVSSAPLSTSREVSSIPMNAQGELWEYPSPQQMFNAMARKGYDGTNPQDVPAMVAIHNWLNEGSWEQILEWERKYFPYFTTPPLHDAGLTFSDNKSPHLVKFKGRPGRPTPKSYILEKIGRAPKAFDHHEWFVSTPDGGTRRYVIDYYGVDELSFSVDVRPAVDDFQSFRARAQRLADEARTRCAKNNRKDQ